MITVILPISRKEYLLPMFKCLEELQKPPDTELLLIIDGDKELVQMVDSLLDVLVGTYRRINIAEFGDSPASAIADRRIRISQIHNYAKQFIKESVSHVFLVEDDTNFAPDSLMKLYDTYHNHEAVFVQGFQVGRWKTPYIGAWRSDYISDPTQIYSLPKGEGVEEVDAGGLYCCLVDQKLYFEHLFQPYDPDGKNGLGCDVNFGMWLKRKGHKVLTDWNVECGHYKDGRQLRLADVRPVKVTFTKEINGKWMGTGDWFDREVS